MMQGLIVYFAREKEGGIPSVAYYVYENTCYGATGCQPNLQ